MRLLYNLTADFNVSEILGLGKGGCPLRPEVIVANNKEANWKRGT